MFFVRGQILSVETIDSIDYARVKTSGADNPLTVLLIYPYNTFSKPLIEESGDTNQILIFRGINGQLFGVPYNVPLQNAIASLQAGEHAVGSAQTGNKIIFKVNGDIEITTPSGTKVNLLESGDVEIDGSNEVRLGGASSAVLNLLATMQVTIPGGSSAGTYPVTILTSGQTVDKVKA